MAKKKKFVIPMNPKRAKKKGQEKKWYMDKVMIGAQGTGHKKHRCDASHLFPSKPNYRTEGEDDIPPVRLATLVKIAIDREEERN